MGSKILMRVTTWNLLLCSLRGKAPAFSKKFMKYSASLILKGFLSYETILSDASYALIEEKPYVAPLS